VALSINEVKSGLTLLIEGEVWLAMDCQHVKPGKGAAFVRVKMRNLKNGNMQERTFRGEEKVDSAYVDERKLQYQYVSGDIFHFMDQENYEEISLNREAIGDKTKFLKDNMDVLAYFYKNDPLYISIPNFLECEIIETEPGIRGDTAKGGTKPAKIETGAIIQVPLFVNQGDRIKLDTRTGGTYVERVS